ncbi:MAG TPA: exodeoxyribonuclease V subunit alpha [Spirochaetota bacterium]|nr:exodeoxyribonuclease V subunit alpha [Spirochaetota bacterium]
MSKKNGTTIDNAKDIKLTSSTTFNNIKSKDDFYNRYSQLFIEEIFCEADRLSSDYILEQEEFYDPLYHLILLALSRVTLNAHVCYQLGVSPFDDDNLYEYNDSVVNMTNELADQLVKFVSEDFFNKFKTVGTGSSVTPVVYFNGLLYFYKQFFQEKKCALLLLDKASQIKNDVSEEIDKVSKQIFAYNENNKEADWQYIAARAALKRNLTIITGGPGTGKTTTVYKIYMLLAAIERMKGNSFTAVLTAPTGKAAARMFTAFSKARSVVTEDMSMEKNLKKWLKDDDIEALTVHRLIGSARQHIDQHIEKLPYNLVIVDEASMMSLSLLYKLLLRLRDDSILILLGDSRQLASVDAGAIMADICYRNNGKLYSNEFKKFAVNCGVNIDETLCGDNINGLTDSVIYLQKSYRFSITGGIGMCAEAVKTGNHKLFMELCSKNNSQVVICDGGKNIRESILQVIGKIEKDTGIQYGSFKSQQNIKDKIESFNRLMFLCAVRKSDRGVESVNNTLKNIITNDLKISGNAEPLIVTGNMYDLGLYNGDTGLVINEKGVDWFYLENESGESLKRVNYSLISSCEPVYSMTVHKSQGSEFDNIVIILPDYMSPVLSRELIYTALTRARERVYIISSSEVLEEAVKNERKRMSGLGYFLER